MAYKKQTRLIGTIALLVFCLSWESNAQKQIVLVKVYNQTLEPFRNEEVSINGGPFIAVDKAGQLFSEFNDQDLPPKSVQLKNELFEVATWNYSKGKIEIVVRLKTSRTLHVNVYDDGKNPVRDLSVKYQGKLQGITNANGSIEFSVPLDAAIQKDHFEIDGYQVNSLEALKDGKYILQTKRIPQKTDSVLPKIAAQSKTKKPDLTDLDSIRSFSELYNLFRQLELKKIDAQLQERINSKFRELLSRGESSRKLQGYTKRITDSSRINDDIGNLVMQAQADRELISAQRNEFDLSAQTIQDKLSKGIENIGESERKNLTDDLANLEKILLQNEQFFSDNHEHYLGLLSTMKEKFFDISVLEKKLTVSEAKRLEEQERFRERILFISSLVFLFSILVVLLMRSERRLRKVNQRISEINENLEDIVLERTKMLSLSNKELDTFLYRASHDLRSPVCSIIGLCNIASHVANPESLDLLQKVTGTVHVMDKLLKKLSVISEINEPSGFGKVNLKESILNTLKSFEHTIRENKVSVSIQCDNNINFSSYPNLLDVVLSNIIENALFYSLIKNTYNAKIDIEAKTYDNKVQVTITDNGIGIDNQIKSRLFDMFFKGNENSKGNGLGLYIVFKSIQALKGEVEVESQPGLYSKFIVTLPDHIGAHAVRMNEFENVISE
jgi:signal transduction histidine kinase